MTTDEQYLLVTNRAAGTLTLVDIATDQVLRNLEVGGFPIRVEVRPDGKVAYVANTGDNMLTVIDLDAFDVMMTIVAGEEPDGMAWTTY